MLDIRYIRDNVAKVKENLKKKNLEYKYSFVDELIELDLEYRQLIQDTNLLKNKKNKITDEIAQKKTKNENVDDLIKDAKDLPNKIKEMDDRQRELKEEIFKLQNEIPNIVSEKTPIGKDESENKEIEKYGNIVEKDFKILAHSEIAEKLNLVDFESSRNVSGKGFYYLKGDLALLNQALLRYVQDYLYKKKFTYVLPPLMINKRACDGVIDFDFFRDMVYKIENEDLYLIGTSEHPLIAMFINKVIFEKNLPIKMYSYSSCFRKEIGAHGLDERGLFRLHQFDKVEQVVICNPDDSESIFEELKNNSVEIFTSLGLPTRVLEICTGDLGSHKHRQVDIEVWSPRKKAYIEVGSCSNLTEAQAIGLNIRVKSKTERYFAHTLNNTGIATSRALVAILENFQTREGTIKIPEVLVPYMYGKTEIKKNIEFF
ncbi:MAG: serine--tRNA ligase [archaeon]|nr:serine--tRNA ligase [archaeon]MDD2477859.1 serine--tRNA ligase [Candidatus ainarchaeum sp.]MDD3084594.1 serine--tRNA ligase [Candidatus ainarchaeum sp.]MDD4221117.1 serine--tRNA ligase [Candidatus ainarchaeum sp.]MDD4662604.1 serine--tRNA ligase [Candidatus ainarchaeum sp.]